jgi:hypothetical protein
MMDETTVALIEVRRVERDAAIQKLVSVIQTLTNVYGQYGYGEDPYDETTVVRSRITVTVADLPQTAPE